jgi:hypothetical protein
VLSLPPHFCALQRTFPAASKKLRFSIDVRNENGRSVASIDQEKPGTQSSIVNAGPGSFFLDILAANVEYVIIVEDCAGTAQGQQPGNQQQGGNTVMNVPNKPLPNTGGPFLPAAGEALLLLVGVGLAASVLRP